MKQHDLSYWEAMAERYFLAETTEEEEMLLRKFLCTNEAQDCRFDEIRATLSFLHVGRARRTRHVRQRLKVAAIAACLSALVFLGWCQYQQQDICSVRIAGQDVEADASLQMERQMTEMFTPFNP